MFSRVAIALNVVYVIAVAVGVIVAPSRSHTVPGALVLVALAALCIAGLAQPEKRWLRQAALSIAGLFFTVVVAGFGFLLWERAGLLTAKPVFALAVAFMALVPGITAVALLRHKEVGRAS